MVKSAIHGPRNICGSRVLSHTQHTAHSVTSTRDSEDGTEVRMGFLSSV